MSDGQTQSPLAEPELHDVPMMIIELHAEWPGGGETFAVEVEEGATEEEIQDAALEAFFEVCTFYWSRP